MGKGPFILVVVVVRFALREIFFTGAVASPSAQRVR